MKLTTLVAGALAVLLFAVNAQAILIDRGSGLIYDNVLDITWTQNANLCETLNNCIPGPSGTMTWADANQWAANLVFGGFSDWRLASMSVAGGLPTGVAASVVDCSTATEVACRDNEYGYMFYQNLNGALGNNKTGNQVGDGGVTLNNIQDLYWSGTAVDASFARGFGFVDGGQGVANRGLGGYGWAVRNGDVVAAPEPASILLLGAGLSVLLGVRRLRR